MDDFNNALLTAIDSMRINYLDAGSIINTEATPQHQYDPKTNVVPISENPASAMVAVPQTVRPIELNSEPEVTAEETASLISSETVMIAQTDKPKTDDCNADAEFQPAEEPVPAPVYYDESASGEVVPVYDNLGESALSTNENNLQQPAEYDVLIGTKHSSTPIYQPLPKPISEEPAFDAKAFTKMYGKKLRRTSITFGIIAIISSVSIVFGILFGFIAMFWGWVARLVVRSRCPKGYRRLLKKRGRAGKILGFIAIILSIAWLLALAVIFVFFADFTATANCFTDLLGFRFLPEILQPIQEVFNIIRNFLGL
jgi:hypothetical protein